MANNTKTITIILPTYNEVGNCIRLIKAIKKVSAAIKNWQINFQVVDDNSPDETGLKTREVFKKDDRVQVTIRTADRGLASAVLHGIRKSKTKYVLLMDADFNHHPRYIPKMLKLIEKQPDIVISGSRYISGGGMDKKEQFAGSRLVNLLGKYILAAQVYDFTGGFLLINRSQLLTLPIDWIFRGYGEWGVRLQFAFAQNGIKVKEIPVFYHARTYGESKTKLVQYSLVLIKTFFETRFSYPKGN